MVKATIYPPADTESQWVGNGNVTMPRIEKLVLHTTESAGGWPGYAGGSIAPTLTYEPFRHQWRQHCPINGSARTLIDPDSTPVRENRDHAVQVEISCYCDPRFADSGFFVGDLDDRAIDDLGTFVAWLHTEWRLSLHLAELWLPYPASGRADSPARMNSAEYDGFRGILGHQHVSGNDHGDPGALDVAAILQRARTEIGEDAPVRSLTKWRAGDRSTVSATEAELLRREFLRSGPWATDGRPGTETVAAVRRFQTSIGAEAEFADGQFGPVQWARFWSGSEGRGVAAP